ncbi:Na+/H+ antiporter subunit D [Pseudogracilibacillus auburnensis]|uniref:Multisubunit sodium/proton antiporter MrpD subunit n=1 Tax=Pseudogracilibacillus auburnensis TaxID=1494959 RepID=A0A2V3W311_9BACI|nr:Na+/H+ antiporter subunit D [Pseudogracilibacillus auburnensis]MBO1002201.1 Na+/H+ antiporter subunit D [Pseudogracilibacillus auburnensis]PXW87528.1 multisubunit sodium/proton antiporter MrpD subunit [Pseudogracilibacillus auburnensis]
MNNLIVLPMVLPLLTGVFIVFFKSYIQVQRWGTFILLLVNVGISVIILRQIQIDGIISIDFGGWAAPFGILFVADSFAALLVLTTNIVSAICVLYAMPTIGKRRETFYFYPFVNFLVAGVNGSFLTGDIFNLFVTFEVMLLASYALITLGGTRLQLKESLKYIAINVVSSSLFLIAIAYLYGTLGTLNMAHLSMRIAESGQTPLLTVISLLFLIVFSLKSGLLLYQWLPGSYSTPPTAIAALFGALLTKVGIYALFRTFTLLFYHEQQITHTLIAIMAGVTLIGGCIGAIAYNNIRQIVAYNVVIAVGFILVGLAIMNTTAIEGAIYYLVHDMIVKALLFLLAGTMIYLTKSEKLDEMSGLIRNYPSLGWMFFITVLSLTGIPPLSGFIGKVLLGQGAIVAESYILLLLSFMSGFVVLYSLLRIFMSCFWGETIISEEEETPLSKKVIFPSAILVVLTFALGFGAESIAPYVQDAAYTLTNPSVYINAILPD